MIPRGMKKGDQAFIAVADGILKQMTSGCYLYRMGGDEFAMLCLRKDVFEEVYGQADEMMYACKHRMKMAVQA